MATKTITTNGNNGYTATLKVTTGSQSVSGNYTNVDYVVNLHPTTGVFYGYTIGYQVKINGKQVAYKDNTGNKVPQGAMTKGEPYEVCSGSTKVYHEEDGTAQDVALYVKVWTDAASYTPGTLSKSGTIDIATIARQSVPTFSPSTVETGKTLTVTTNRQSKALTHTITLTLGNSTITKSKVGASTTISIPDAWADLITTNESKNAKLSCKTIYDGKTVGTETKTVPIKVNSAIVPSCSAYYEPEHTSGVLNGWGGYLAGYTKASLLELGIEYPVSGDGDVYNVGITKYTLLYDGKTTTYTSRTNIKTALLKAGKQTIQLKVTDARGRSSPYYKTTINVTTYNKPSASAVSVYRSDEDGNEDDSGQYIAVLVGGVSYTAAGSNKVTLQAMYTTRGGTMPSSGTPITQGVRTVIGEASLGTSYDVKIVTTDSFGNSTSYTTYVPTKKVAIQAVRNSDGSFRVSLGKYSEYDGFEVEMNASFNKDLQVLGTVQPLKMLGSQYYSQGKFGLDLQNSDLIKVNSIYFNDAANGADEGLMFAQGNDVWDTFRLHEGNMYITTGSTNGFGLGNWKEGKTYNVDYPIERGTSGDWKYIKYKSGWAECWKKLRVDDVVCSTAWGNAFVSANINLGSYPFSFSERPIQNVSIHQTSAGSYLLRYPYGDDYSNTASACGSVAVERPSSYSTKNRIYFSVYAAGYLA